MSFKLATEEIKKRMIRLTNLEYLHKRAKRKIRRQENKIKELEEKVRELEEENQRKDEIIKKFSLQLEELRIKVFGKKKKKGKTVLSKSKKKTQRTAESYRRPIPTDITKEETHAIDTCAFCQTALAKKRIAVFYVEDIPFGTPQREAIKHMVEQGYCEKCKKWRSAIPLPCGKCVLGVGVRKYVCYLSIIQRLSNQQIEDQIRDVHQIKISQGEIQKILHKEADKLRPDFEKLKARVQSQKAQHYDETSWKVLFGKFGGYGWGMFGAEKPEAVFELGKSRGGGVLKELHPNPKIGITDDYGVYKNSFSDHQLCWSHPHRKFRDLAHSEELNETQKANCVSDFKSFAKIYAKLAQTIQTEFDYEKTKNYFLERITEFAKPNANDIPKTKTLKATLLKNKEKYLTCLKFPGLVPLDNNKAERGLRHLVIKRKISYGSKTDRGAETTSILASVLLSMKWMNPDTFFQKYFLEGC